MSNITGAGLILFVKENNEIKYCILLDNNDKYDFPKGAIEKFEFPYECALREGFEEANIESQYIKPVLGHDPGNNFLCGDNLVLYLCEFDKKYKNNLRIKRNPETDIVEHKRILWLNKLESQSNILYFMSESLEWAESKILNR